MRLILFYLLFIFLIFENYAQVVFGQNKNYSNSPFSINYSNPRELTIADIQIKGIQYLDNTALISLSGLKVGDKIKIPGNEISGALKKLWNQGLIGNIKINILKIENEQVWLEFEMSERPRLSKHQIQGINKTHRTEIEKVIELTKGRILTNVLIKNAEIAIRKYLDEKGFLNAEIELSTELDPVIRNSVVLVIKIDKKKKVKIRNITFEGNEKFSDIKLRSKLKKTGEVPRFKLPSLLIHTTRKLLNPKNLVYFLTHKDTTNFVRVKDKLGDYMKINIFKPAKFIKDEYEKDKKLLIDFYNSKGYRDAVILEDTVFLENNKYLGIKLKVSEGRKYYFRNIKWLGNFVYPTSTLERALGIKKGDVYDLELLNKKLNYDPAGIDISSLYLDNGYLFFNINPVEVAIINDSIDVEMRIYEGAQATINKVIIKGNDRTNEYVIRRELRTYPGELFSRSEIIRTQRELSQMSYFNPESINPVPLPNPATETVDIEWRLEEQPSDQIQLSAGWGGGSLGFIGSAGITFNNFSFKKLRKLKFPPTGDAQRLSINFQTNGLPYQSYNVSYTEPWLGGRKPLSFTTSYNYSISRILNNSYETTGSLSVQGINFSLGQRLRWPDDFFILSNSIGFLKYNLFQYGSRLGFSTGDANSITFNTTFARNSSDNPMYPRRGSDLSLSIILTPPYSLFNNVNYDEGTAQEKYKWIEYNKWIFDAKYYINIIDKLVLAPRFHFGFLNSYTNTNTIGPFERFVLGGDGLSGQSFLLGTDVVSLRGYPNPTTSASSANSVTPYDKENGFIGGTVFSKYVMELRYPISLAPTATIYVLTFMEAGNNWLNFKDFNPYEVKRSAGFGIRIFMPAFGLLGLDYGYGFDKPFNGTTASGSQFHFSIGQTLR